MEPGLLAHPTWFAFRCGCSLFAQWNDRTAAAFEKIPFLFIWRKSVTGLTFDMQMDNKATKETQALDGYKHFLPSQVQNEIWSSKFVLFVENLSVSFDGFKAVDIPQYGIEHGELRVIIGPNGAGKTTFCDLVSGKTKPSTGKVFFDGREITKLEESDIALSGIGRKFLSLIHI